MRIVLDTDVMVAALRSQEGASRAWLIAALKKEVQLVLSVPLILQYEEVLFRPEQLKSFHAKKEEVTTILDALCEVSHCVNISYLWRPLLKDPTDEMVLEAAVHGQAKKLLTFNQKDFVGAEEFGIIVETPGTAWKKWR